MSTRHAAVRPRVELLALRASDRRPHRHAAVRLSVELLALRASDRRARRHAAVRPIVELLTLRASDRRPRRHAAVRLSVELLALRASGRVGKYFGPRPFERGSLRYPTRRLQGPRQRARKALLSSDSLRPSQLNDRASRKSLTGRTELGTNHTTPRRRYETPSNGAFNEKGCLFCRYPTALAVRLTGMLGMLWETTTAPPVSAAALGV